MDPIGQAATLVTPVLGLFCDLGTETQAQKDLQRPDHVGGVVVGLFVSDGRVQKELLILWSSRKRYRSHLSMRGTIDRAQKFSLVIVV